MQYIRGKYQRFIKRSISLCLLAFVCPSVFANPSGGQVAAGNAGIRYGATTVIMQTSNRAVINWKSFSINANEATQFITPGASAVTLNRVTGGNPSEIMGSLSSNGQIFLVNPNGIVFGKTAHVDVAGLVASTANISDSDFMSGRYHFFNAPNGSSVINEGSITVHAAGLAALVAPNVRNSGTIHATLGKVALAAGKAFTLDLYGDNLITFDASSMVTNGSVKNLGRIEARGGHVSLSVAAADSLLESVVNTSGYISAQSVGQRDGKIVLQGYGNATIQIAGTLDVSGTGAGEQAGVIQATADTIQLLSGSFINATGSMGGGTVQIGGEYRGGGTLAHAQFVSMDTGAQINASALQSGNGGQIILWSDKTTQVHGNLMAQGGTLAGNGGLIETSSAQTVDFAHALINTSAQHGTHGLWLIDPTNIDILDADATTLSGNLASSDITLSATNDITFDNATIPVSLTNNHSFTVNAGNDLTFNVNDAIQANGSPGNLQSGNITLTAGNDIFFNNPLSIHNTYYSGAVSVIAGNNITFAASSASFGRGPIDNNFLDGTAAQTVNVRADNNNTGTGTIIDNTGGLTLVNSPSPIYFYYSPTAGFSSPTFFSLNSLDGNPTASYMLVYNSISGHTLSDVASTVNGGSLFGSYALAQNVSGLSTPIGTSVNSFKGEFTGGSFNGTQNYYTISNITINTPGTDNVGLFGYIGAGGIGVHNITLLNSSFTGQDNVGSIVGYDAGNPITNVYSNATVTGRNMVGGLVGSLNTVSSLTAGLYAGTINASGSDIGGLVGLNDASSSIATSLAIPVILGGTNVGGAIGNNQSTNLFAVYSSTASFSGPVIGTGITTGTDPFAAALPASSLTSLPPGFNDPSIGTYWQATGNQYYVSLISCSSIGCQVPVSTTGSLGNLASQYTTTNSILNNNVVWTITVPPLDIDGSLMYTVPLSTGAGIYVLTVTYEPNPKSVIESAFETLQAAYGCGSPL